MRLLVTGGAGFIGSNFVQHVLGEHANDVVIILDKLTYAGNIDNIQPILSLSRVSFIQGDICNPSTVIQAMAGCDAVVHCAAETHVDRSITQPQVFLSTNILGTHVLLEAAKTLGVQRFIYVSTDEVYGNARSPEGLSRPSLESDALMPLSPYAASKAAADRLTYSYWATYGLPVVITRCSNTYGPYQYPEKQLPLFILNALERRPLPIYGDGQPSRDWIHVQDHVRALDLLVRADEQLINGEIFNIGSTEERTILQNAIAILDILGESHSLLHFVEDRPGHVHRHAVNATKLRRVLAWQPTRTFSDGILQTINWYRENPRWIAKLKERADELLTRTLSDAYPKT